MTRECEICRGSRIVRLPIYRRASAAHFEASAAVAMEASSRDYPCPECGGAVREDRVAVLDTHVMVDSRIDDPAFQDHARRAAAHMLVNWLLDGGYLTFERGRPDANFLRYPVVASLGVVSKGIVATIEERATSRGMQLASAAADEAIRHIDNWGSASRYIDHRIEKARVREFIHDAVKRVGEKWSKAAAVAHGQGSP